MSSLRNARPRPFATRLLPAYPRLVAIGAFALLGCAGQLEATGENASAVQEQADGGHRPGDPDPQGGIAMPFDGGAPDADVDDADVDGGVDAGPDVSPSGAAPYPFDAEVDAGPDTGADGGADSGEDAGPNPAGDIAYPFDGGAP